MIDTIVLTLNQGMFVVLERDRFTPSANLLYSEVSGFNRLGGRANMKCTQNPTPYELKIGKYKPRLTLTKRYSAERRFEITLKIEFSVPKLVFGNNFDELSESDFPVVIQKLRLGLRSMGVDAHDENLINAPVSAIHFGKNIPLTDYSIPRSYIAQLAKANYNKSFDMSQTDYFNGGTGMKAHSNSSEIAFYDKLDDLRKAKMSEKRAYEKDYGIQKGLFDNVNLKKPFEVLRMEIRLGKRQKIRQVLSSLGLSLEPTFKNLFSLALCQKVLLHYLVEIERNYPLIIYYDFSDPSHLFSSLIQNNPEMNLTKVLKYTALGLLVKQAGVSGFRAMTGMFGSRAWYELNKDMKQLKDMSEGRSVFGLLRENITNYKPLSRLDFQV